PTRSPPTAASSIALFRAYREALEVEREAAPEVRRIDAEVAAEVVDDAAELAARVLVHERAELRARLRRHGQLRERVDPLHHRDVVRHELVEEDVDAARRGQQRAIAGAGAQQALDAIDPVRGDAGEVDPRAPDARAVAEHGDRRL